ncbi:hypothetical protein B0T26DRAFT_680436 [Lasiosphaeria miniovina]|uniref:Uncharacterized protein n=1 Tax=Lasiosphaeria miniovina TaxID=1954250 RepID=A0AA40DMZ9_9PEZI|nr:uncharacterized protein B0T26DRAFT_680436 [Lasiosphaeria miniovina]KAK0706807.1 hypothetical protein B0T26DRAFT_680436 [Lasiosphaeria miniovina]
MVPLAGAIRQRLQFGPSQPSIFANCIVCNTYVCLNALAPKGKRHEKHGKPALVQVSPEQRLKFVLASVFAVDGMEECHILRRRSNQANCCAPQKTRHVLRIPMAGRPIWKDLPTKDSSNTLPSVAQGKDKTGDCPILVHDHHEYGTPMTAKKKGAEGQVRVAIRSRGFNLRER